MKYILAFVLTGTLFLAPLGGVMAGEIKKPAPKIMRGEKAVQKPAPKKETAPPSTQKGAPEKKEAKKMKKTPAKKPSIRPLLDKKDVRVKKDPYVSSDKNKQNEDSERFKAGSVKVEKQEVKSGTSTTEGL